MYRVLLVFTTVIMVLSVSLSCSSTAEVRDSDGTLLELEIDRMRPVPVNGTRQWIYESGVSPDNPVLLWLDGGPGGTEVGWVRSYLGALHKDFTVVCWDQRGVGKSHGALESYDTVQVSDYVEDVISLAQFLCSEYEKRSIYLVGHSWGSIIGLRAAAAAPELFSAYIGAAQQINSIENDTISWESVREGARKAGHTRVAEQLDEYGRPPYGRWRADGSWEGDGEAYYYLLRRIYAYSPHAPADEGFDSLKMFTAPEHTLLDRIYNLTGLVQSIKKIYPQLAHLDFEREITSLACPVFLVGGRYDVTCPPEIARRWLEKVSAPDKGMLLLEDSGHNGVYTEAETFTAFMNEVLRRTENRQ